MSDLNSLVEELQAKINKQNQIISKLKEQTKDSSEFLKQIEEKDNEIKILKTTILDLNSDIEKYKGAAGGATLDKLKEKENEISQLKAQLEEKQQKINEIEAQIPACQALIEDLQQQLAAKMQSPTYSASSPTPEVDTGFYPKPSMLSQSPAGEIERQCPQCGASGFAIKEFEDKTKVLSYTPIVYAKKRVCTKCSYEF